MKITNKTLWRMISLVKLKSEKNHIRYVAIRTLGKFGNMKDYERLLNLVNNENLELLNSICYSIKEIIDRENNDENIKKMEEIYLEKFETMKGLRPKIIMIEMSRSFDIQFREQMWVRQLRDSKNDLKYTIISVLKDVKDLKVLDEVLNSAETTDSLLRRIALETWYSGLMKYDVETIIDYIADKLHFLIRATYELQTDGKLLKQSLSYSDKNAITSPKAYPDFMIRYMTELLGLWDYDPDAYRTLHSIMVPSYFTFENDEGKERPYIIL